MLLSSKVFHLMFLLSSLSVFPLLLSDSRAQQERRVCGVWLTAKWWAHRERVKGEGSEVRVLWRRVQHKGDLLTRYNCMREKDVKSTLKTKQGDIRATEPLWQQILAHSFTVHSGLRFCCIWDHCPVAWHSLGQTLGVHGRLSDWVKLKGWVHIASTLTTKRRRPWHVVNSSAMN